MLDEGDMVCQCTYSESSAVTHEHVESGHKIPPKSMNPEQRNIATRGSVWDLGREGGGYTIPSGRDIPSIRTPHVMNHKCD